MQRNSRWPGFYKLSIEERRKVAADALGISLDELGAALEGGLARDKADKIIENVVGTFSLPFALALNVRSTAATTSCRWWSKSRRSSPRRRNAARMIREGGGFEAEADEPVMIAQVQLDDVPDARGRVRPRAAPRRRAVRARRRAGAGPGAARRRHARHRGARPRRRHARRAPVRRLPRRDGREPRQHRGRRRGRRASPSCAAAASACASSRTCATSAACACAAACRRRRSRGNGFDGAEVRDGIVRASRFAERDPYRAATHNKGIMNGIDAVVIATGNDWRAVEAGAHAFAARNGHYEPLCVWRADGDDLIGELEMPLALGTVGGPSRVHDGARMGLRIVSVELGDRAGDGRGQRGHGDQPRRAARARDRRHPARPHGAARALGRDRRRRGRRRSRARRRTHPYQRRDLARRRQARAGGDPRHRPQHEQHAGSARPSRQRRAPGVCRRARRRARDDRRAGYASTRAIFSSFTTTPPYFWTFCSSACLRALSSVACASRP